MTMRLNDLDEQEIIAMQVRALQGRFRTEHLALTNWGIWSRDRKTIGPKDARTSIYDLGPSITEGYAEDDEAPQVADAPVKSERAEDEEYNEPQGALLDERMHGVGGMAEYQRIAVKVAYVSREVPEGQFYKHCACSPDGFLERLEAALKFVSRFG